MKKGAGGFIMNVKSILFSIPQQKYLLPGVSTSMKSQRLESSDYCSAAIEMVSSPNAL